MNSAAFNANSGQAGMTFSSMPNMWPEQRQTPTPPRKWAYLQPLSRSTVKNSKNAEKGSENAANRFVGT